MGHDGGVDVDPVAQPAFAQHTRSQAREVARSRADVEERVAGLELQVFENSGVHVRGADVHVSAHVGAVRVGFDPVAF